MLVEGWGPIPYERLEDYESRFIFTFFNSEDLSEGLEDVEICRIFWRGVPESISTHGTSYEDSFDAQLDNARHE